MPSVTEYSGFGVTNFGPLTTTFTAAPSCATGNQFVYYANASDLGQYWGQPECSVGSWGNDCYPSGEKLDAIYSSVYATTALGFVHYYSPGIACPSGWTTAGTVAHVTPTPTASSAGDKDAFNHSGVFTQDPWEVNKEYQQLAAVIPQGGVYLEVLGPEETLVYCCPR